MNNNTIFVLLILLIVLSAFFSATETAFSAMNKIRLKYLANNGNNRAQKTLDISERFTKLLSTILIGNNIVNILSTALATVFFVGIMGEKGVAVSTVVMTILVLVFGEIMPKTIAKTKPEVFAMSVTSIISFLMFIFTPITFLFEKLENVITKINSNNDFDDMFDEEFITMVEEAQEDGDMDAMEADLLTNAIEFNDLDVGEILTPRVDVIACELNENPDRIEEKFRESGFSRIPCYENNVDNIIGVLREKDFYYNYHQDNSLKISQLLQKVIYTSEHVKISTLLRQLQSTKSHLAVVLDEYGGTAGIITMEDILEELVGEIYDEHDEVVEYYKKIDENSYYVNCEVEIDDFFEYFHLKPDQEEYDFNTTSAWIIHMMDKIPDVGDSFTYLNMKVDIVEADEKIISKIKVTFDNSTAEEE